MRVAVHNAGVAGETCVTGGEVVPIDLVDGGRNWLACTAPRMSRSGLPDGRS